MKIGQVIFKLFNIRNILGNVDVKMLVNGQEIDVEIRVLEDDRVVIMSKQDAKMFPEDYF